MILQKNVRKRNMRGIFIPFKVVFTSEIPARKRPQNSSAVG
jgi:hypothetical protein